MNRMYSVLAIKAVDDDERVIRGIATTPAPDRVGDIVEPLGVKFNNPMPLLHQHDGTLPVGTVTFDRPTAKGITFEARIPKISEPGPLKDRVDTAWGEVKAGLVRAVSIGFRTLEDGYEVLRTGGLRFTKTEVMELSLVTIPAQAEAVITTIKSIDRPLLAATGKEPEASDRPVPPGVTGKSLQPISLTPKEGKDMKTLAEQIAALEAKRAANASRMEDVLTKSVERGETTTADEQEEFDTLDTEVKQLDADIRRLKSLEQVKLAAAKPVAAATKGQDASDNRDPRFVPAQVKISENLPKGLNFARYAKVKALSYLSMTKGQGFSAPADFAKSLYGENADVVGIFTKAAVGAGSTTSYADLVLTEGGAFADFLEFLRPMTIIGQFGNGGVPALTRVPFDTALGWETTGGNAYWVGEGAAKPLTGFGFDRTTLAPLKVASITVVTEELLRRSGIAAETRLRDLLAGAVASRVDIDFITPAKAAVAGASPASVTNGVTAVVSTGNDADAVREDVRLIMNTYIAANNPPTTGVWVMSTTRALALSLMLNPLGQAEFAGITMRGGTFLGMPVIVSDFIAADVVALINARDIWLGDEGGIEIDLSREASLEMADNPAHNSTTPTGASLVSMFQTNSVAFRAERVINWAKARPTAVAVLTSADWGVPVPATP